MFNAVQLQGFTQDQIDFIKTVAPEYGEDPILSDITADYAEELAQLA